jgi:uncharacterized protein (DUF2225 family)
MKSFGPDTDKNYAYEGVLYLCAYLRYKFGPSDPDQRKLSLEDARRTIAKYSAWENPPVTNRAPFWITPGRSTTPLTKN